jgi:3-phosphoshikimate 1-carboxyvinyltransferase
MGRPRILTGAPHLRTRPIADLVEALQSMGCKITYMDKQGYAPIKIEAAKLINNKIKIDASKSSQFVSALCLVGPSLPNGISIEMLQVASEPYIDMTLKLMQYFGIASTKINNIIEIPAAAYKPIPYAIENDWSSACFIYCALMTSETQQQICLNKLNTNSIQGDSYMAELAQDFGIVTSHENENILITNNGSVNIKRNYNLSNYPDLAIPFIVACALKFPSVTISGLHTLALKESDRILALQTELKKVGIILNYNQDILSFGGAYTHSEVPIGFDVYADHRIAMALSLVGILAKQIEINNPEVVSKSFPNYWLELSKIGFQIS